MIKYGLKDCTSRYFNKRSKIIEKLIWMIYMHCSIERPKLLCFFYQIYFTTSTGHEEYVTIPEAVLPSNSFFIPKRPLVPTTIKSTFFFSAKSRILLTVDGEIVM